MIDNATRTDFYTLPVPTTRGSGIPIGQGACKGVVLSLNYWEDGEANANNFIYIGDSNGQGWQLTVVDVNDNQGNNVSPLILCTNLNEVYVKNTKVGTAQLQVLVYK